MKYKCMHQEKTTKCLVCYCCICAKKFKIYDKGTKVVTGWAHRACGGEFI